MIKEWSLKGANAPYGVVESVKLERKCTDDNGLIFTQQSITSFAPHMQKPLAYWTEEKLDEFAAEKLIQHDMDNFPDANKPIPQ
tara:strand:+ start:703 stop:954 length:252 start_codon:yes stop_codon:yes gene_type:complete